MTSKLLYSVQMIPTMEADLWNHQVMLITINNTPTGVTSLHRH